jgi:tRNA pseudouridine55 synthase
LFSIYFPSLVQFAICNLHLPICNHFHNMTLKGLLNLHKPSGMTSRDVVNVVQRLVRPLKVGHAGTLDPLATGVLVVCVGAATRLIEYVQRMPKTYLGTFLLGRESDTEDIEGQVVKLDNPPRPKLEQLSSAVAKFTGEILQRPPAYSALKVAGRRAYELARKGKPVDLKPRPITVHRLEIKSYQYPEVVLEVQCGGGTYIRSLGRDLAESLGTAAVMSALMRTAIGNFRSEEAVDPVVLTAENLPQHLFPLMRAVEYLPRLDLTPQEVTRLSHGLTIERRDSLPKADKFAGLSPAGELCSILVPRGNNILTPALNFPS